jgi:hypothetical protein
MVKSILRRFERVARFSASFAQFWPLFAGFSQGLARFAFYWKNNTSQEQNKDRHKSGLYKI